MDFEPNLHMYNYLCNTGLTMNPLISAQAELESLLKQKAEIERRIEAVTKSIAILKPVYGLDLDPSRLLNLSVMMAGVEKMGVTEAVQWALMASPEGLTPTQVRDLLAEHGYPVRGENPMATVHTVLKRLAGRPDGSVVAEAASGKTVYKYVAQGAAHRRAGKDHSQSSDRLPRPTETPPKDAKK
jgi:hypothetical protein